MKLFAINIMVEENKAEADEETNWDKDPNMNCRFYPNELPNEGDYVTSIVTGLSNDGCYIKLLEYNNQPAFVVFSEITRRRANSVAKYAKIGRIDTYLILRVDKNKKFIDCSKIKVKSDDADAQTKHFLKAKLLHTIFRVIAFKCKIKLEEVYSMVGWPLYKKSKTHPIDQLKDASLESEESLFPTLSMTKEVRQELCRQIKSRFAPKQIKLRADFEMTCYSKDGVNSLRKVMTDAMDMVKKEKNEVVEFKFISSPKYTCEILISDKARGIEIINYALELGEKGIKTLGGEYLLKNKPQIVGENEEDTPSSQGDDIKDEVLGESDSEDDN